MKTEIELNIEHNNLGFKPWGGVPTCWGTSCDVLYTTNSPTRTTPYCGRLYWMYAFLGGKLSILGNRFEMDNGMCMSWNDRAHEYFMDQNARPQVYLISTPTTTTNQNHNEQYK